MKDERGFTIVSLLAVLAISAMIATGAGMILVQALTVTQSSEEHTTTVRQAQNLGYWASQDLQMGKMVSTADDLSTPQTEFLTVAWKDWVTGDMYEARYTWLDGSGAGKKSLRTLTVRNKSGIQTSARTTLTADSISSANLTSGGSVTWKLDVRSLSGDKSATRYYDVSKRVD
ncbi:MAG: prepilin-type N-terminal cleavage/methylation domain-containing protein [Dehalococcoidales bacterium]|nr:prepilin-type N-terminal cleavage/methylation domain-containing protein [Dehalococcoidales bacterium]